MMLLIITVSAVGADYSGTAPNVQDLCPNFSGTGFGIINVAYTLAAIISPLLSGAILKGQQSLKSWGTVFQIAGVVYILVTVIYIIMGSAEEQEWNNYDEKEQERKRKSKTQAKESAL
ncbi:unnamed protein product [Notodromas monacha]|uniref:Major facilitator superfamily (MFS) profile domain-containing protein n=1 Tax=Notodromas monacha TaxID=399045 RepID=A0A7R9C1T9_9CRUS|nr:unnamed protein product [Notodromas monacha]CAG0924757.1 unnamed protein product [Notodromas monacha]